MKQPLAKSNLMCVSIRPFFVGVQHGRHRTKHLQDEWLPVHQIELFHGILDRSSYQFIGLVIGIDLQQSRHDQQIPILRTIG